MVAIFLLIRPIFASAPQFMTCVQRLKEPARQIREILMTAMVMAEPSLNLQRDVATQEPNADRSGFALIRNVCGGDKSDHLAADVINRP